MAEKEITLIERMRLARELRMAQCELDDCRTQLQLRESKIQELQRLVVQLQEREIEQRIAVEEETQCSLDGQAVAEQRELVDRLSSMLHEREEQGVGLHLATIDRDRQITALTTNLHHSQDLAATLHQELTIQHAEINHQEHLIHSLKNENEELRQQLGVLEGALQQREAELAAQRDNRQNLRILQENRVTLQHIIIQNQKQKQALAAQEEASPGESALMAALLEKEVGSLLEEKEKMKKIINNYDWKLFCLETELDLSNKEKKQYKFVNDKHESRMAEFEATVKQMTIKIYSLEEEVKAIEEENRFLEAETDHKQRKISDLTAQLEEAQNGEAVKEFEYRLREKDEELTEITSYLKEKMKEHHEIKLRSGQLEKSLQEAHKKVEKAEFEAYEMEQCLIEHEEIMQKQTDRIDESARETDFLNGKINELSLMNILRTQEFEEKLASLQAALREKSQKVNDLSVEIIEREIESNKKMDTVSEQMTAKLQEMEGKCAQMGQNLQEAESVVNRLAEKLREAEEEVCRLEELSSGKNHEINKIVSKMNGLELTVKEKEKLVQFLQAELKAAKCDFKEVRLANRRLEEELEELREVIAVSEEKLKILKKDAVESIETELNNELEMDQLKRQVLKLESERTALTAARNATQEQLQRAAEVIAELQAIGKDRLHQMVAHLTKSQANADDTTTFELLCEQDFEALENTHERERNELLEMMGSFSQEIDEICGRIQQQ